MLLVPASEQDMGSTLTVDDCPVTLDTDPYAPPPSSPPLGVTEWSGNRSRTGGKSSKRSGAERWAGVAKYGDADAGAERGAWGRGMGAVSGGYRNMYERTTLYATYVGKGGIYTHCTRAMCSRNISDRRSAAATAVVRVVRWRRG